MSEFNAKAIFKRYASALVLGAGALAGTLAAAHAQTPRSASPSITAALPERLSDSFAEIAAKVEPSVVSIDAKGRVPDESAVQQAPAAPDDILEFFRRQMPRRQAVSVGSGFIIDKAGFILTNAHVVDNAAKVTVRLDSGEEYPAKVIGTDEETDLAVLKIDAGRELPAVTLGDSERARVGDWVLAIGSPFGLTRTVTAGIISQTKRETPTSSSFQKFLQTDAAINRGNSGGPLVNMAGEVIGVNSQIATSNGDYNGIGFALPAAEAAVVFEQIVKNGKVRRGYLGVGLESVKAEYAKVYGMRDARGAILIDVRDTRGAAASAGMQVGDVIVEFNGKTIGSAQDLITQVASTPPDQTVGVTYLREAPTGIERRTAKIRLGERPSPVREADSDIKTGPADGPKRDTRPFGLALSEVTPQLSAKYRLEGQKGVLVTEINPDSFIADVKLSNGTEALSEGDLIQRINRVRVTDPAAFAEIVGKLKKGDPVVLHVLSFDGSTRGPQLKIVQFTVQ